MSGPFITEMGDVISSALSIGAGGGHQGQVHSITSLEAGQIEAIYAVDAAGNTQDGSPGTFTLYDVRITRPDGTTELINRCRMAQPGFGGGINNFLEVLPTDPGANANQARVDKSLKRGHHVLLGFIGGYKDQGVILGALPHPNSVAVADRPSSSNGTYTQGEIQGLNFSVDNDGALKVVFNGPRDDKGNLINQNGPTTIEVNKDGVINLSTNKSQSVSIDRTSGVITITNGPTSMKMDQNADQIDIVANKINVGSGGLQPQIVGDDMVAWLSDLVDQIMQIFVATGVGPSSTPINNPAFSQLKSQLKDKIQSKKHWVEK